MSATGTCLETRSGLYFDYLDPQPEHVSIMDVSRGLAHTCRFAGQTAGYLSVAEHAIMVRNLVIDAGRPDLALVALHHDSHEAYLGDVPSPLKRILGARYNALRIKADEAIGAAFALDPALFHDPVVAEADQLAMRIEASRVKLSRGIGDHWGFEFTPSESRLYSVHQWAPSVAEWQFYQTHLKDSKRCAALL